jgi:hypothetical protein
MTLSSLSSFATTAFDTARTTFKAMAEAAVPPADADRTNAAGEGGRTPARTPAQTAAQTAAPAKAAAAKTAGRADAEEQTPAPANHRRGTVLDAYA